MEIYLLKSATLLGVFFVFYKLVLENTSIHHFKRFYLFASLLAAFLIPLITFTTYVEPMVFTPVLAEVGQQKIITATEPSVNYWAFVLWTIYGLGVLFFSVKFFRNLFGLIQKIKGNPKFKNSQFINVLLKESTIPHTFFSYIFLNRQKFENGKIPQEVMLHEQTHAIEKHSLDVIFIELLQIVFWFNPLLHFIKRSIKLNHEFLADQAVLKNGAETSAYQKILLAFTSNDQLPSLAHSLNYSSIKKRFNVMKTRTSKRAIWFRSLLLLPLLAVLIYGFSTKEILQKEVQKTKEPSELIHQKATKAEIAEYNKLAKKYNAVAIEKRIIPLDDLQRLETIYRKMTDEQKAKAQPFPECLPPPPPPSAPAPTSLKNISTINISRSNDTQYHFNTQLNNDKPIIPVVEDKTTAFAPKTPSLNNGNLYMAPEAPPAPNPDPVEYIKELAKRGATFYIGPHKYSTDEAIELVKKSKDANIDVSNYPKVILGGC